jgi:hypothetical protein
MRRLGNRYRGVVLAMVAALGGLTAASAAKAATPAAWPDRSELPATCYVPPPVAGSTLAGSAVTSTTNAWAVGSHFNGKVYQTLAEHWNGSSWAAISSVDPGGTSNPASFNAVAASGPSNAWAVGTYCSAGTYRTLIEHWNGSAWAQSPSVNPGAGPDLMGVTTGLAAGETWAVGDYQKGSALDTLVERWSGSSWQQVASPNPGTSSTATNNLQAVAATSASNAWAVGSYYNAPRKQTLTLIEHWNGSTWTTQASPNPGTVGLDFLYGVAATSTRNAWAVGQYYNGHAYQTLIEHWNGRSWTQVPSPNPAGASLGNSLSAVTATSASNAWAVGAYLNSKQGGVTLVLHWNGSTWTQQTSPDVGPSFPGDFLFHVAAVTSSQAWAVGQDCANSSCSVYGTLVEEWNGTSWVHVKSP